MRVPPGDKNTFLVNAPIRVAKHECSDRACRNVAFIDIGSTEAAIRIYLTRAAVEALHDALDRLVKES